MDRIRHLLARTSRTFALGIRHLPSELERTVTVAYLLLRVSDYYEDNEVMEPGAKIAALEGWAEALGAPEPTTLPPPPEHFDDATPDALAAREADAIFAAFRDLPAAHRDVLRRHVVASTHGMARWVATGPDFATEADLDDYMFEVAGRVGLLLTDLFALELPDVARRREEMERLGVEFGLGLQTVNVVRGLSSDPARGWIFLPRSFLPEGLAPERLWAQPDSEPALALVDRLADKADRHLDAAQRYVLGIPRREHGIRVFCLLPLIFARRTLDRSRRNPSVYSEEVKLSRQEVRSIAVRTVLLAPSDRWVRSLVADATRAE